MRHALTSLALLAACKTPAAHKQDAASATKPAAADTAATPPPAADAAKQTSDAVALPGGDKGIGFDDLRFSRMLGKVVVPGGGTGNLVLIDPTSHALTSIGGFGTSGRANGHEDGTTSADEGGGYLYAIDRTKLAVDVIDTKQNKIVGTAKLASGPDYVRWVDATHELWVTEPDEDRIEVFSLTGTSPKHTAFIAIKGGPESLVIYGKRAFTHLWKGSTVVVDITARKITATWPNGCAGSRGIALDAKHNFLFVGCGEGKAVTLDADSGKQLGSVAVGAGVDIIDYNPALGHLYVPSGETATLSIIAVAAHGQLTLLGTAAAAPGTHCVTADDKNVAWVCDPQGGRLLAIRDTYAP